MNTINIEQNKTQIIENKHSWLTRYINIYSSQSQSLNLQRSEQKLATPRKKLYFKKWT